MSRANILRLVGACALVETTRTQLMLCDKIFRVCFRQDSPIDPAFLAEVMKTPFVRRQIERDATGTSPTMKNISKPALLALRFPLPPLDTQHSIVEKVAQARAEAGSLREAARQLHEETRSEVESMILGTKQVQLQN